MRKRKRDLYWEQRAIEAQQYAEARADIAALECFQLMVKTYQTCREYLRLYYEKLEDGYKPTVSELNRSRSYIKLCNEIAEELNRYGEAELEVITVCLEDVAEKNLSGFSPEQITAIVSEPYEGKNYSDRVWHNTEQLSEKLKEKIETDVVLGRSYQETARDLQEYSKVGAYAAKRLVVTETARVQTKAAEEQYREAGVERVEILVEPDACDECKALEGKTWILGKEPTIPVHPNCRCALLPVIE